MRFTEPTIVLIFAVNAVFKILHGLKLETLAIMGIRQKSFI